MPNINLRTSRNETIRRSDYNKFILVSLSPKEASWIKYCLEYVDACYEGNEISKPSGARKKELKLGRTLHKFLESKGAK